MKRPKTTYFLALSVSATLTIVTPVYAADEVQLGQEILDNMKQAGELNSTVKKVGLPDEHCPGCAQKAPNLKVLLDKDTVDLGKPYYLQNQEPYVVYLKRTAETPSKVDLKFQNGHRYCEKMYVGTNPWMNNGPLVMGCMLYLTRYEDEEISLNLKNLPSLPAGESDVIEVKFIKKDPDSAKYTLSVKHLGEAPLTEELDKKFFGSGYNVTFKQNGK